MLSPLELGRASLTYAFGGLAYKGVALLSVPILARLLSPSQLGLLDLAAVLASIVGLTVAMGTDQSVAYHERRVKDPAELWASALTVVAAAGVVAIALGFLLREPLGLFLSGRSGNDGLVAAAGLYGAVMALSSFALVTTRLRASARTYALASFLIISAEMAAALTVAWLVAEPVTLMVVAWAAGSAALSVPFLVRHLPRLHRPTGESMRRLLAYGGPLVPATMAWLVGDVWIRATLAREADLVILGEYGIAYRIASVLGLLVTGFGVAWYPYLYASPSSEVGPRAGQTAALVVVALGGIAVAATALAPEIVGLVAGPAYAAAREAVGPLTGGMVAMGVLVLAGGVIGSAGSTRRIALAAVTGVLAQVSLATPLVENASLAGAGLASLAGYAMAAVVALALGRGRIAASDLRWVALAVLAVSVALLIAHAVSGGPFLARLALAAFGVAATATLLVRVRFDGRSAQG